MYIFTILWDDDPWGAESHEVESPDDVLRVLHHSVWDIEKIKNGGYYSEKKIINAFNYPDNTYIYLGDGVAMYIGKVKLKEK